jgi:hypothetical protein
VTDAETQESWGCDDVLGGDASYFRGVDVDADPETVFRWLCQLRVAPYSYDLIDNLGRRSPRHLTPGLEDLDEGQTFMEIFRLVSFDLPHQITLTTKPGRPERLFGRIAGTYRITSGRLIAKLNVEYPAGPWGAVLKRALPWGDLIMMRRQLLTLKKLAEGRELDAG